MHALHLLRHAKSSRDEGLDDHERRLSRSGREAARRVGEGLPAALGRLNLVLCSTSVRTRETAALVMAGFASAPRILYEDALYLAGPTALVRRLSRLEESDGTVLVVGHNPGLHELAIALADAESPHYRALATGKFPTAARASLKIETQWAGLDQSRHALTDYVTPKSLGGRG